MVDLLKQRHESGRRFEPIEFIEEGSRIAVGMTVSDRRWGAESVEVFKVFSFDRDRAVLLQDCSSRDDALAYLASQ